MIIADADDSDGCSLKTAERSNAMSGLPQDRFMPGSCGRQFPTDDHGGFVVRGQHRHVYSSLVKSSVIFGLLPELLRRV